MNPTDLSLPNGGTSLPPNTTGGPQPTNRMSAASLALRMIQRRQSTLGTKWDVWEEVQSKYDCEPPDSPAYLRENGMGHSTNVCWGTLEARVDEIVETYYNLATGGKTFLRFHSRAKGPEPTKALQTLAAEHKIMWDAWEGRQEMMETLVHNRSLFPFSAVYYDQPNGWHCKALHPRNLIYPENASVDVDSWFWCAVRTSFEAWQLLDKLKDESKAREVGWKPEAIRKACELFCKEGNAVLATVSPSSTFANVAWADIMPHDLAFNDRIPAFVFYVREWDGSITEHILVDHTEVGYLFTRPTKLKRLSDSLRIFPHALGSGTLDTVRSYGVKTLTAHDALDRLNNAEFDTALVTSSLILQSDGGTGLDKMSELVLNMGGVTALPSGFVPAQVNFKDSAAGIRLLKQDIRSQLGRNTPALAGDVEIGDYEKSQREAAMVYQTQLQLGLFKVDRFRSQMNGFGQTHWKRLLSCIDATEKGNGVEEAQEFFKIAASTGVSPDLIGSIYRVTHKTGSARGNRVNAQIGMDRSRQYMGMFSEEGKRAFAKTDIALAMDDEDESDAWMPSGAPSDGESEQQRLAMLENSAMAAGEPVTAAGTDIDPIHMGLHTDWVVKIIQDCMQGLKDPASCLKAITLALQHVGPHFQRMQMDQFIQDDVKAMMQTWSQIENKRREIEQQLAKQQQEAQRQQAEAARTPMVDPKDQQRIIAGQLEMQQKEERHQQEMRHSEEDQRVKREGANVKKEGSRVPSEA